MTDILLESRRGLRQRAFQALMSLEYEGDLVEAVALPILMIRTKRQIKQRKLIFQLLAQSGLWCSPVQDDLDKKIASTSKAGQWIV
ncbi:hypothetical protein HGP05_01905 [Streptococcus sanguinis]|uniref:Uncharacterized protein n=1 Tax=Streptococcus sanguinis TaxID=1305 RepID=A0A7Y0VB77_STRSA|nr:hypothetical protein [Streptococcus sanguinis]